MPRAAKECSDGECVDLSICRYDTDSFRVCQCTCHASDVLIVGAGACIVFICVIGV